MLSLVMFVSTVKWCCLVYDGIETVVFISGVVYRAYRAVWFHQ